MRGLRQSRKGHRVDLAESLSRLARGVLASELCPCCSARLVNEDQLGDRSLRGGTARRHWRVLLVFRKLLS